jgi:hypothetical protein
MGAVWRPELPLTARARPKPLLAAETKAWPDAPCRASRGRPCDLGLWDGPLKGGAELPFCSRVDYMPSEA